MGEKDRLVWLLTPERGAVHGVARGLRAGRPGASLYDPPTEIRVRIKESSGLSSLSQPVLLRPYLALKGSLPHLAAAGFFARLVLATLPEGEGDCGLYRVMLELLEAFELRLEPRPLGLWGQWAFLNRLGARPELERCVGCGSSVSLGLSEMRFDPAEGALFCSDCGVGRGSCTLSAEARDLIRGLDVPLRELPVEQPVSEQVGQEAGVLFREQFRWQLGVSGELFRPLFGRSST